MIYSDKLNKLRKKMITKYTLKYGIGIFLCMFFGIVVSFDESDPFIIIGSILVIAFIYFVGWANIDNHKTQENFYALYRGLLISSVIDNLYPFEISSFELDYIPEYNIFDYSNIIYSKKYFTNCHVCASVNNKNLEQFYIRGYGVFKLRRNSGVRYLEYDGKFITIDTDLPDFRNMNILTNNINAVVNGSKINTGNQQFDNIFKIYSENANYFKKIMTTDIQNALIRIYDKYKKDFVLTVKEHKLYIYINNKKSPIKPSVFREISSINKRDIINDFNILYDFINFASIISI